MRNVHIVFDRIGRGCLYDIWAAQATACIAQYVSRELNEVRRNFSIKHLTVLLIVIMHKGAFVCLEITFANAGAA